MVPAVTLALAKRAVEARRPSWSSKRASVVVDARAQYPKSGPAAGFAEAPGFGRGFRTWLGFDGVSTGFGFAGSGVATETTGATDTAGSGVATETTGSGADDGVSDGIGDIDGFNDVSTASLAAALGFLVATSTIMTTPIAPTPTASAQSHRSGFAGGPDETGPE